MTTHKNYPNDYAVYIGRFQPVHKGHVNIVKYALMHAEHVIIGIGSANSSRRPKNPFTYREREEMWRRQFALAGIDESRVSMTPINDSLYSDTEWVSHVRHKIGQAIWIDQVSGPDDGDEPVVAMTGYNKDDSSYYLKYFPEWSGCYARNVSVMHASDIREAYYDKWANNAKLDQAYIDSMIDPSILTPDNEKVLIDLAGEWDFNEKYDPSKFPIIVSTVDTVVTMNGHVLVVKRKHKPGQGLNALPGGHIEGDETLERAALRELREETKIDLSDRILRANIRTKEIFDHPKRSDRGRVITTAFHINLSAEDSLPRVKGSDDAALAFWMPLSDIKEDEFFEDHGHIINKLTAGM